MLCKIGEVEIWRILELNAPYRPAAELFPDAGAGADPLFEAQEPGAVCPKTGGLMLPVQAFLLRTPRHTVLVDTGLGNHKTAEVFAPWMHRDSPRFMAGLTAAGVAPEDVDYVMFTHLHVDHIGWNTTLAHGQWVPTFPKARYLFPAGDLTGLLPGMADFFAESVTPVFDAGLGQKVTPEDQVIAEIRQMATPGHTPGHVSLLIESQGQRAVITGDALHKPVQCAHPDWRMLFDSDGDQGVRSRRKLLAHCAETGALVIGMHFAPPSIGRIRHAGDAFAWEELY